MDIMAIVNAMQLGTISKQALSVVDFPNDEHVAAIPFMGVYVLLTENGVLPDPAAVNTYAATYNANILSQQLLSALSAHRYAVENGGTIISGNAYKTDPESRLALTAIFVIAATNNAFTSNWKMADGTFVTLSSAQIIEAAQGVLAFVQKCFDTEKTLAANVANYPTSAAIVAAFDTAMTL